MTPQEAKKLLAKLEQLNQELDLLDQKMAAAVIGEQEENKKSSTEKDAAVNQALSAIKEKLGADFVRRSFW